MGATTGHDLPAEVRASDADRDAVIAALSEHFQAGRLTQDELDDRIGRALTTRTWGELRELLADLPASGPGPQIPAVSSHPLPSSSRGTSPLMAALAGLAIAALVLVVLQSGWGLIWLAIPALIIARRLTHSRGASEYSEPKD